MRIYVVAAIGVILLLTALSFGQATDGQCDSLRSVCPRGGFVPDQQTAVLIAETVLTPIYGRKHIESERPFTARLHGNRWIVKGTLSKARSADQIVVGGTAVAEIDKADGRIIAVYHLK